MRSTFDFWFASKRRRRRISVCRFVVLEAYPRHRVFLFWITIPKLPHNEVEDLVSKSMRIHQPKNDVLGNGWKGRKAIVAKRTGTYLSVCQDRICYCIEFPICIHDCFLTFLIHIISKSNKWNMLWWKRVMIFDFRRWYNCRIDHRRFRLSYAFCYLGRVFVANILTQNWITIRFIQQSFCCCRQSDIASELSHLRVEPSKIGMTSLNP